MKIIDIHPKRPVLIAGPTASGKSALALQIAAAQGGVIVNADALQVFDGWQVLTARPGPADLERAKHRLYGHIAFDAPYSVGEWLRDLAPLLAGERPIIIGGTGLYFSALTEGLATIPVTPAAIRAQADAIPLPDLLSGLDPATRARIDLANRSRVQRAWEVLQSTGKPLAEWQDETPAPLLALSDSVPIVLDAPKDWLNTRIAHRFRAMLDSGAIAEARRMEPFWNPALQSSRAIGARELIAHLRGQMSLTAATEAAIISTRQYAKRQRTWFRKRMRNWHHLDISSTDLSTALRFIP